MARALRLRRPLSQGSKQRSRALHSKRILCDGIVTLVPGATPNAKMRSNGNDLGRRIARPNGAAILKAGLREANARRMRNISATTRSQFARRGDSVALIGSFAVRSVIETALPSVGLTTTPLTLSEATPESSAQSPIHLRARLKKIRMHAVEIGALPQRNAGCEERIIIERR